jgi:hypothetical protein
LDRFEVLLDVLEANGFPEIRSKMREREDQVNMGATFRGILTAEEIDAVKKVLKEFKVPGPTGWANAMVVHGMRQNIARFSEDNVYDYNELCNLSYTLREAGLVDSSIWKKIDEAKENLASYSCGA